MEFAFGANKKTQKRLIKLLKSKNMNFNKVIFLALGGILSFTSCEKAIGYRLEGSTDSTVESDLSNYPKDGTLAISENFQSWNWDGYTNLVTSGCDKDIMRSSVVMYRPDPLVKTYGDFSVNYTLQDFSVSPNCENTAGTSTDTSSISTGYLALQCLVFYRCGNHDSDAMLQIEELPSVSRISFSVSYGGDYSYITGLSLWKKSEGESKFTRIGNYVPENPSEGEVFNVDINEKNVALRFTPTIPTGEVAMNDTINRAVRIHDLKIWSMKE